MGADVFTGKYKGKKKVVFPLKGHEHLKINNLDSYLEKFDPDKIARGIGLTEEGFDDQAFAEINDVLDSLVDEPTVSHYYLYKTAFFILGRYYSGLRKLNYYDPVRGRAMAVLSAIAFRHVETLSLCIRSIDPKLVEVEDLTGFNIKAFTKATRTKKMHFRSLATESLGTRLLTRDINVEEGEEKEKENSKKTAARIISAINEELGYFKWSKPKNEDDPILACASLLLPLATLGKKCAEQANRFYWQDNKGNLISEFKVKDKPLKNQLIRKKHSARNSKLRRKSALEHVSVWSNSLAQLLKKHQSFVKGRNGVVMGELNLYEIENFEYKNKLKNFLQILEKAPASGELQPLIFLSHSFETSLSDQRVDDYFKFFKDNVPRADSAVLLDHKLETREMMFSDMESKISDHLYKIYT